MPLETQPDAQPEPVDLAALAGQVESLDPGQQARVARLVEGLANDAQPTVLSAEEVAAAYERLDDRAKGGISRQLQANGRRTEREAQRVERREARQAERAEAKPDKPQR